MTTRDKIGGSGGKVARRRLREGFLRVYALAQVRRSLSVSEAGVKVDPHTLAAQIQDECSGSIFLVGGPNF